MALFATSSLSDGGVDVIVAVYILLFSLLVWITVVAWIGVRREQRIWRVRDGKDLELCE